MKKTGVAIAFIGILLITILLIRTFIFTPPPIPAAQPSTVQIDKDQASLRLSKSVTFKTISHQDASKVEKDAFISFHRFLETSFPLVHSRLQREILNELSLLYTWEGKDKTEKPILLYAHLDVVPAAGETDHQWSHPPFEGILSDGFIHGRGTLDDKCNVMGIFEAVEKLLDENFQPERTVFLAFGHDEEVSGKNGARIISERLSSKGIRLEFVLDEGAVIVKDVIPGVPVPVALIGIAEKGYLSLELSAKTQGGHSSMPPKHTAIGALSRAIASVEESPLPARLTYSAAFFEQVGPRMPFSRKIIFSNMWLFNPLVKKILSASPELNAGIRTTAAATIFTSGVKENVLPTQAIAVLNFRILPGETASDVAEHVRKTIDNPDIQIRLMEPFNEPSPVADRKSKSFNLIKNTIYSLFPGKDLVVAPFLVLAATDSRYFVKSAENVYRFSPIVYRKEDLKRPHGINERIAADDYVNVIRFYYEIIRSLKQL
ncbi:MAG: M20 family peptidase [Thermodesulfobacteriota bacterium]